MTLLAIKEGHSTAVVGVLVALYAFLPMLCAVAAGRVSDRVGVRRPMLAGSLGLAAGALIPVLATGLFALFVSAALVGVSFMVFQVAAQNATGELGDATARVHNFSLLALGYSISGLLGPLIAGFTIDHAGFATSFAVLAVIPLVPVAILAAGRLALPGPPSGARRCASRAARSNFSRTGSCGGCLRSTCCWRWAGTCTRSSFRYTARRSDCPRRRSD